MKELRKKAELTGEEVAERDSRTRSGRTSGGSARTTPTPRARRRGSSTSTTASSPIAIKPLDPAKYLKHTVWDRGNKFALLSATILNKAAFCRSVGLDPSKVALVDVEHTFPVENRPLYDVTRGKMTYEHRDETLPKIARLVVRLMAKHPDEKGLIHCHSYAIQAELRRRLAEMGLGNRVRGHDRDDRNAELETWKATDRPEVFLSVKMEEALDLNGDLCRWQVLCKAPYLNTNDSRVARRLEDGQWGGTVGRHSGPSSRPAAGSSARPTTTVRPTSRTVATDLFERADTTCPTGSRAGRPPDDTPTSPSLRRTGAPAPRARTPARPLPLAVRGRKPPAFGRVGLEEGEG